MSKVYDDAAFEARVEKLVRDCTKCDVRPGDYANWLEPDDEAAYNRFDQAARHVIGERAYAILDVCARVQDGLLTALNLINGDPDVCGGVDVKAILANN
jgi:hypothetical protein